MKVGFVKVGDRVTWTSQAAGCTKTKHGKITEIILPGERPNMKGAGLGRDHVSYLVREDGGKLYWPRVAHLRPDESSIAPAPDGLLVDPVILQLQAELVAMTKARDEMARFMERMIDDLARHEDDPSMMDGHRELLAGWQAVGQ